MSDPHRALLRALTRRYPGLRLVHSRSEPWASVTFTGDRHEFRFAPAEAPAGIADADLPLPGHFVADIVATARPDGLAIDALTIVAT